MTIVTQIKKLLKTTTKTIGEKGRRKERKTQKKIKIKIENKSRTCPLWKKRFWEKREVKY